MPHYFEDNEKVKSRFTQILMDHLPVGAKLGEVQEVLTSLLHTFNTGRETIESRINLTRSGVCDEQA